MSQPNLLILMSDEHQSRAMGCAGHAFAQTPHLDALAARGVRFTNAYTPSPICVPARAAFATGRHVHETRLWDNAMPYCGQIKGWGHALQGKGVPVESIGKLHYRDAADADGFDQKHDPMMVVGGHGMVWASIRRETKRITPKSRMLGDNIGPGESAYTRYDRAVTARTIDWLQNAPDEPWCLYVGLVAPHFPLVCPQAFLDLYPQVPEPKQAAGSGYQQHPWIARQNANFDTEGRFKDAAERQMALRAYYGLCSFLDHNVGQILGALEAAGLSGTTRVIYTSDHGDNAGARGLWGKSNHYEESAAVPLIMAGPGVDHGTCDTAVSLLDLSAEIADHFDAPLTCSKGVKPLSRVLQEPEPDRAILSQYHAAGAISGAYMLRAGRWKLIHYEGFDPELFDLVEDPEELTNLAGDPAHADTLRGLYDRLHACLDPGQTDAQAFADQDALIAGYGGRAAALKLGAPGATPPPKGAS